MKLHLMDTRNCRKRLALVRKTQAPLWNEVCLFVFLEDNDTSDAVTGATVRAGGVACVSLGGEYGCPVSTSTSPCFSDCRKNGYDNLSDRFDTLRATPTMTVKSSKLFELNLMKVNLVKMNLTLK